MNHRLLRLCAILGTLGIALTINALAFACGAVWQAARRGDLPVLTWGPAR